MKELKKEVGITKTKYEVIIYEYKFDRAVTLPLSDPKINNKIIRNIVWHNIVIVITNIVIHNHSVLL